jgi:hypothetical protein
MGSESGGVRIRRVEHQVLYEHYDIVNTSLSKKNAFIKFDQCGGNNTGVDIESQPCVRCCLNTCNECRVHVTYQSLVEDPWSDLDNQRWWAGQILLSVTAFRLLPPASPDAYDVETATTDARWNEPIETMLPNHDAGRIGVSIMECEDPASPESVQKFLDEKIGHQYYLNPNPLVSS